jgi:hypothetical protein
MIGTLLEKLFVSVGVDLTGLGEGMSEATREVKRLSDDLKRDFGKVGESWKATGEKMVKVGAVMSAGITAPLVLFGKHAAQAAIDAEEMESAFNVVFGNMAGDVRKWAEETGNAMGRSTQEMERGALAFQELFGKALDPAKAAEMSKQFAVLTQDLSSFKNLSIDVARQKLFSGLTGEAEPLRAVGVFLNDAAVEAKLLQMGIQGVNGKFTDQEKILGRAAIIREQLANADGDVIRTADSAANRIRASQSAYEELSITVGAVLIPAITPLIGVITNLLEGFNQLEPGTQSFIIGAAAIAAAVGPIITAMGALITVAGAIMPALGAAIPMLGGLVGGFGGLLAVLAPALPLIAAIGAAGYLIYENWEKIAPVLSEFWEAASEALGPPILALISTVSSAFQALWTGPIGDGIRTAMGYFLQFQAAYASALGSAFVAVLQSALSVLTAVFQQIGDAIRVVNAILTGDWAGAWGGAWAIVNRALAGIPDLAAKMVGQLREWLITRMDAIWQWVIGKVGSVKQAFFELYDAVVGHSYIPDMVDGIGANMARLQALMVDPAAKATKSTGEAFRNLASNVSNVLDRLFPLQAQLRAVMEDMATLDKARAAGQISGPVYDAARAKLEQERSGIRDQSSPSAIGAITADVGPLTVALGDLSAALAPLPRLTTDAEFALQEFGQGLGDTIMMTLRDVLSGRLKDVARDLLNRFFAGAITDALKALEKGLFGEGGLGGFLGGLFSKVISGRAVGGPVVPGRAYTVGSGELFQPSQSGRVLSRSDAMRAVGGGGGGRVLRVEVDKSDYFDVKVREIAAPVVQSGIGQYDAVVGDRVDSNFKRRA